MAPSGARFNKNGIVLHGTTIPAHRNGQAPLDRNTIPRAPSRDSRLCQTPAPECFGTLHRADDQSAYSSASLGNAETLLPCPPLLPNLSS